MTLYDYGSHYPAGTQRPNVQVGFGPNGLGIDNQGRLVVAEHSLRRVVRRETNGTNTVLASHWDGKRLRTDDQSRKNR